MEGILSYDKSYINSEESNIVFVSDCTEFNLINFFEELAKLYNKRIVYFDEEEADKFDEEKIE